MIFLKPTILRDRATSADVTNAKYNFIRTQQIEARERRDNLTRPSDNALLPELPPRDEGGQ
jgi:general secretion pathway protein D